MKFQEFWFAACVWFSALGILFQVAIMRSLLPPDTANTMSGLCVWMCLVCAYFQRQDHKRRQELARRHSREARS